MFEQVFRISIISLAIGGMRCQSMGKKKNNFENNNQLKEHCICTYILNKIGSQNSCKKIMHLK